MNITVLVAFCCLLQHLISTALDFVLAACESSLVHHQKLWVLKIAPRPREVCFCYPLIFFLFLLLKRCKEELHFPHQYSNFILYKFSLSWGKGWKDNFSSGFYPDGKTFLSFIALSSVMFICYLPSAVFRCVIYPIII